MHWVIFARVQIPMYMGVHVCGCLYRTLCTYEGLRLSGIAISCSSHIFRLGKGTQPNMKLTNAVSRWPVCLANPLPRLEGWAEPVSHHQTFTPISEDSNASPHTGLASPQPQSHLLGSGFYLIIYLLVHLLIYLFLETGSYQVIPIWPEACWPPTQRFPCLCLSVLELKVYSIQPNPEFLNRLI